MKSITYLLLILISQISFAQETNVQLIKASEEKIEGVFNRYFEVEVIDLGDNKNIQVHHHMQADCWYDFKLQYSHTLDSGNEIWNGQLAETKDLAFFTEFVIKYEVNDTAYWDNNQNKNYSLIQSEEPTVIYGWNRK